MRARLYVQLHGKFAIGHTVLTESMGDYPGGLAVLTEIYPDSNAPEIVCVVNHPSFGEIGIFEDEELF